MPSFEKPSHIVGLADLLRKIERILTTDDVSVRSISDAAGLDPRRDFRGIFLNGLPLADQDIRGFDFSGSDLRNTGIEQSKRDHTTKLEDAIFDGPSLDQRVILFNRRLKDISLSELKSELAGAVSSGQRKYDVVSFTTAIARATDVVRAAHWYEEMKNAGVAPNVFTFSALVNKSPTEEGAARWYEEMKNAGVAPNVFTFSALINKSLTEESATRWYEEMKNAGVKPDDVIFNTLINKSETEAGAARWYEEMKNAGVAPDVFTFSELINKSPTEESAARWYEEMKNTNVKPTDVTFNTLINKSETGAGAAHWYEEMKNAGVAPNSIARAALSQKGIPI